MGVTEAKPVKQLKEFLKEQQEPFVLQVYLAQPGYSSRGSQSMCSSCRANSGVSLERSSSCEVKKSRKGIQHCSKLVSMVYKLLISRLRFARSCQGDREVHVIRKTTNNKQAAELDSFSSSICAAASSSSPESDAEETSTSTRKDNVSFTLCHPIMEELLTKLTGEIVENNKRDSQVSRLDNMSSHTGSPPLNGDISTSKAKDTMKTGGVLPKKDAEESILSASLWKILFRSTIEKPINAGAAEIQELVQLKPKMVLQKTKQLLFDWMGEIVVTLRTKEVQRRHQYLRSQQNEKLSGEKMKTLLKRSRDELNLTKLLELDIVASPPEWRGYRKHARDIAFEIADAIMEEVKNETVMAMIHLRS